MKALCSDRGELAAQTTLNGSFWATSWLSMVSASRPHIGHRGKFCLRPEAGIAGDHAGGRGRVLILDVHAIRWAARKQSVRSSRLQCVCA